MSVKSQCRMRSDSILGEPRPVFSSEELAAESTTTDARRCSVYVISSASGGLVVPSFRRHPRFRCPQVPVPIILKQTLQVICFALYNFYICEAIVMNWKGPRSDDVRLLVGLTLTAYVIALYYSILKKRLVTPILRAKGKLSYSSESFTTLIKFCWVMVFVAVVSFVFFDSAYDNLRLVSFFGLILLVLLCYVFSNNRRKINWRTVTWGVLLQFILALVTIRWPAGKGFLATLEDKMINFFDFTDYGTSALYGYLVNGRLTSHPGNISTETIFYFKTLMMIVFISSIVSVLYHYGLMQKIIGKVGFILEKTMGTTSCESMAAASSIILAIPECCMTIKPYLGDMTLSEMHAVLTSGFATIASSVFVAYVELGAHASVLVSASLMSAPASLTISKILFPETEKSETEVWNVIVYKGTNRSGLEALVSGAIDGMALAMKVSGNLIGFISFISFINYLPGWFGSLIDWDFLSTKWMLSKLLWPVAFFLGAPVGDCNTIAWLIGVNLLFTNMASYKIMGDIKKAGAISERGEVIATYAICGFCNLSTVGVAFGTISSLVPEHRRSEMSPLVLKALLAGCLACFMSACIAGSVVTSTAASDARQSVFLSSNGSLEFSLIWSSN